MIKFRFKICIVCLTLLGVFAPPAFAFDEINKSYLGDVALGGYDAVSYFSQAQAVEGDEAHVVEWKGATWLFSSDSNRKRFANNPESFAPQYGGYCSNQMSLGNLSDIDPQVWRIIAGKLYLFGHEAGRVRWASDTQQRIADADQNWQMVLTP